MTDSWRVQSQESKSQGKKRTETLPKKEGSKAKTEGKLTQDGATGKLAIAAQKMLFDGPFGTTSTREDSLWAAA